MKTFTKNCKKRDRSYLAIFFCKISLFWEMNQGKKCENSFREYYFEKSFAKTTSVVAEIAQKKLKKEEFSALRA